jgi:hypothetical protein
MVGKWLTSIVGIRTSDQEAEPVSKSHPKQEEMMPLRPVGLAFAAVVAGLGVANAKAPEAPTHAPLVPATQDKTFVVDHTNHPGFEEDASFVVGASAPVAPFSDSKG